MDQIRVDDYISVCSCCLRYTEGETYLRLREGKEIKVYRLLKTNSNWYSEPIPFVLVDDITKDYLDNNLYGDGQWKTFFDYDDFYNMDNYKVETR